MVPCSKVLIIWVIIVPIIVMFTVTLSVRWILMEYMEIRLLKIEHRLNYNVMRVFCVV